MLVLHANGERELARAAPCPDPPHTQRRASASHGDDLAADEREAAAGSAREPQRARPSLAGSRPRFADAAGRCVFGRATFLGWNPSPRDAGLPFGERLAEQ